MTWHDTNPANRAGHWDETYRRHDVQGVSWFQAEPQPSLELIETLRTPRDDAVVDVGGGTSFLVDRLIQRGWRDLTLLDVSPTALGATRARLGADAPVTWLQQDLLTWSPARRYGLWHDRAVLHFMVEDAERRIYRDVLRAALEPKGSVILATFAADGPEYCSGLPVRRYAPSDLVSFVGDDFEIVSSRREEHVTPAGVMQPFTWLAARLDR
jgi:SAM-dependent methyltransferase